MAAIRASAALNRAYAFVRSERFGAAASELAEGLRRKGFETGEAARAIELRQAALPGMDRPLLFLRKIFSDYKEIIYIEFGAVRCVSEPNRSIDGGLETASPASRRPIWR